MGCARESGFVLGPSGPVELVGESSAARAVRERVAQAAAGRRPVLVVAEAGLDAEAVARAIHAAGPGAGAPFVVIDCAAPDAAALEAQLFGTMSPPAAGARARSRGRGALPRERVAPESALVTARGGTLLLKDIVELPASVQGRLARLVRDGELLVGGAPRAVPFDVRLMATAPPTLDADVAEGRFRADLARRLAGVRIDLPPLRHRPEDIPAMVVHLMEQACVAAGVPTKQVTHAALGLLGALPWRGNVGDLRGVIERLVAAVPDRAVQVEHVLAQVRWEAPGWTVRPNGSLRDARRQFEREYVAAMLERHHWRMSEAARALGLQRPNLYRKLRQLGLLRTGPNRGRHA